MNKKVTILIPCFNEEEGLSMLYDALCGQNGLCDNLKEYNFEILLINDGSRDNTLDVIKSYAEKDRESNTSPCLATLAKNAPCCRDLIMRVEIVWSLWMQICSILRR